MHHRLAHHGARRARRNFPRVVVHKGSQQLLIERAPIGADPHRLAVLDSRLDDEAELLVPLVPKTDIAGVYSIFVERLGAGGMIVEQLMADIMEIADQRDVAAHFRKTVANMRHGRGGLIAVDGDPHEFGARIGERRDLGRRPFDIGRIRVGHRLDGDRRAATGEDRRIAGANAHANGAASGREPGDVRVREAKGGWELRANCHVWCLSLAEGRARRTNPFTVAIMTRRAAEGCEPSTFAGQARPADAQEMHKNQRYPRADSCSGSQFAGSQSESGGIRSTWPGWILSGSDNNATLASKIR